MNRFHNFLRGFLILSTILAGSIPAAVRAQPINSLIKGSGPAVYFYAADGKRYVFPNARTFDSWYPSSAYIVTMTDADLGFMPLGGNVTIKPGSTLVKIATDPKVYAVSPGRLLRWVGSETIAQSLYGAAWNKKVVDVPDVFFANYLIGDAIQNAGDYSASAYASAMLPDRELFGAGSQTVTFPTTAAEPAAIPTAAPSVSTSTPTFDMTLGASQAALNQQVQVFAQITGNPRPITKLEIWSENGAALIATCVNSTSCSTTYTVTSAPLIEKFYAVAYDANGKILMPADQRPTLVVASTSNDLQMSLSPQTIANGSRAGFDSEYTSHVIVVKSHKIFGIVPGNPQPYLWKDCGVTNSCAGSTVFYRTTDLFSQITYDGGTIVSPVVRVTAEGGTAPKPVLTATVAAKNLVDIALTPPSGEMIGQTTIVDGTKSTDQPLAMCDGPCRIALQINTAGSVTAFTWVGGKQEASNSIAVMPE